MERFYEDWHSLFDFDMHHLVVHWKRQHELCWCRSISVSNHELLSDDKTLCSKCICSHSWSCCISIQNQREIFFAWSYYFSAKILYTEQHLRVLFYCHFIFFTVMQYFYPQASNAIYHWFISIGFGTKCDQIHSEIHASCFQHHFSYWIQIKLKCYWLYDYWWWFEVYFWFCVSYRRELLRRFTLCLKNHDKNPNQVGKTSKPLQADLNWFNTASSSVITHLWGRREYGQSGCFICSSL